MANLAFILKPLFSQAAKLGCVWTVRQQSTTYEDFHFVPEVSYHATASLEKQSVFSSSEAFDGVVLSDTAVALHSVLEAGPRRHGPRWRFSTPNSFRTRPGSRCRRVPLDVLEEQINLWIAQKKAAVASPH